MNRAPWMREPTPTYAAARAAMADSEARWLPYTPSDLEGVTEQTLRSVYDEIKAEAESLSGGTRDAVRRAIVYLSLHEASGGNFMFPLIATHGSLWGVSHTLGIEQLLARIAWLSRHGRVQGWLDALDAVRDINRRVFVEIYTTFYFTRLFGHHPDASALVNEALLPVYNRAHDAARRGVRLSWDVRQDDYFTVFVHEQHDIVHPGILEAIKACRPSALVSLFGLVRPRFRYFPPGERLFFTDFTSVHQRNREGLRALAFAEEVGVERVIEAMGEYPLAQR